MDELPDFVKMVYREMDDATEKFGPLASPHEAYAVMQEELDEFWDLVKEKRASGPEALHELVQIAAMAYRTAIDERLAR